MTTNNGHQPVALVTGASRGLGLALARALAAEGWALVIDARGGAALRAAARELAHVTTVRAVAGDIADETHRRDLIAAVHDLGGLDALVHNASVLGPSPQPALADYPLAVFEYVYAANVFGPLRLTQLALPELRPGAAVVSITSDAAVEAYEGWGGYGSSKAALEQVTNILAAEHPGLRVYRVDPGDMNTQLQAEAFPGEDISDRPPPEESVPGLLRLITGDLPSGRYQARDLAPLAVAVAVAAARHGMTAVLAAAPPLPTGVGADLLPVDFELPDDLIATEPVESAGGGREDARLMVARRPTTRPSSTPPSPAWATSSTPATCWWSTPRPPCPRPSPPLGSTTACVVHLSTELPGGLWLVELRRPVGAGTEPFFDGEAGRSLSLPGGGAVDLLAPYPAGGPPARLWFAVVRLPTPTVTAYLARHGRPIRYGYVRRPFPISAYQTVFARQPGSAEMPSAGRPFTTALVTDLVSRGVGVSPIVLHTGVSSAEPGELPYPERFRVPVETAERVNATRQAGHRVIAVGTTVTRALETAADERGRVHPAHGWTELVITPERGTRVVDGLRHRLAPPGRVPPHAGGSGGGTGGGRAQLRGRGRGAVPLARVRRRASGAPLSPYDEGVKFRLEQRFPAPVDDVEDAYVDADLFAHLQGLADLGRPELLDKADEGDTVRLRVRYAFTGELEPPLSSLVDPARITWVEESTLDRCTHRTEFHIVADHYPDRLRAPAPSNCATTAPAAPCGWPRASSR